MLELMRNSRTFDLNTTFNFSGTFLNLRKKILIFKAQNSVCLEFVSLSLYEQSEITLFFIITLTNYKRSKKVTLGDGHIFLRFNLSFEL